MLPGKLRSALLACALAAGLFGGQPPVYKLLYSAPDPSSQGARPETIFEAAPGFFYFLSGMGGLTFGPSIFSLTNAGAPKLIYSFQTQLLSYALVQGSDGRLYGSVSNPSDDDSFYYSVSASGQGMQRFPTGRWGSMWSLTPTAGKLFDGVGTTAARQTFGFARIDQSGSVQVIYKLSSGQGVPAPGEKLVLASDGNLYGVGCPATNLAPPFFVYRLTPSGEYTQILTFPSNFGAGYGAALVAASDGNLYGTLSSAGTNNVGIVFETNLSGQWSTVANFPAKGSDEGFYDPNSLVEASDGALYGATVHDAIFRFDLATHALTLAYQMNPYNLQGSCAPCNFIQAMDGNLYGTAALGGPGGGAVFSLDFGLPKPTPGVEQLVPSSGSVGQKILFWGSHLLGATSVKFNGVPATDFQVNSTQALAATVPAGATTGPVTVTTANGKVTSRQSFTIQ